MLWIVYHSTNVYDPGVNKMKIVLIFLFLQSILRISDLFRLLDDRISGISDEAKVIIVI